MKVCLSTNHRTWLAISSTVLSLALVGAIMSPPSFLLTAAGDVTQSLLLLWLLVAVIANLWTPARCARMFWIFMAGGVGLWLIAQFLWTYFEVIQRKEVPNPFVGDIAIVLHLIPIVAALVLRPDKDRQASRLRSLDFALLFSWWLYLYLFFVIPWQYVSLEARNYGINFDVLYFAGHVVVLFAATMAWRDSSGLWRATYWQILITSFIYAVTSIAASIAIDYGKYYTGSLYDVPLIASVLLFVRMALLWRNTRATPHFEGEHSPSAHSWVPVLVMVAAGSLPVLAAWAMFFSDAPTIVQQYRLALTLAMIVFVGALRSIRQHSLDKELARANRELQEASVTDELTGIRNRRFLATILNKDAEQAVRIYGTGDNANRNRDLIFYLIDIDHFKMVNDQFGHQQGDDVLVQVAARISSAIRYSDVLIRWGGEEFLVVSRFTDRENAEVLAKRVLHAVGSEPFRLKSGSITRTCSVGWAAFPWWPDRPDALSCDVVLRCADHALYEAKNRGRNRAVGIVPELLDERAAARDELHNPLLLDDPPGKAVLTLGP